MHVNLLWHDDGRARLACPGDMATTARYCGLTAGRVVLQEDGYDPYRLPYWIRASFIMEERWGELEAEFNAAKDAVQLAEEWGVVSSCALSGLLLPAKSRCCPWSVCS